MVRFKSIFMTSSLSMVLFVVFFSVSGCSRAPDVFGARIGADIEQLKSCLNAELENGVPTFNNRIRYNFKPESPFFEFKKYALSADKDSGAIVSIEGTTVYSSKYNARRAYESLVEEAEYAYGAFEEDSEVGMRRFREVGGSLLSISLIENALNGYSATLSFFVEDSAHIKALRAKLMGVATLPAKEFLDVPFETSIDWFDENVRNRFNVVSLKESDNFIDLKISMTKPFAVFTNCAVRIDKSNGFVYRICLERAFRASEFFALQAEARGEQIEVLSHLEKKYGFKFAKRDKTSEKRDAGFVSYDETSYQKVIGTPGHFRLVKFVQSVAIPSPRGNGITSRMAVEPFKWTLVVEDVLLRLKNREAEERDKIKEISGLMKDLGL